MLRNLTDDLNEKYPENRAFCTDEELEEFYEQMDMSTEDEELHRDNQRQLEEISHLMYVRGLLDREMCPGSESALKLTENDNGRIIPSFNVYFGKKQDGTLVEYINPDWAREMFDGKFLAFVRQAHGHYIPVPVGRASEDKAPDHLLTSVPIRYNQGDRDFCLTYSMASCLYYCGYKLAANAITNIKVTSLCYASIQNFLHGMKKYCPEIGSYVVSNIHRKRGRREFKYVEDILENPTRFPTLLHLIGCDGSSNHSVTVVDDLIFDSTQDYALKLKKESFDWICGANGIAGFNAVYQFNRKYHTKEEFKHQMKKNW